MNEEANNSVTTDVMGQISEKCSAHLLWSGLQIGLLVQGLKLGFFSIIEIHFLIYQH